MKSIKLSENPLFIKVYDNVAHSTNGDVIKCYRNFLPESYTLGEEDFDNLYTERYQAYKLFSETIILQQNIYTRKEFSTQAFPNANFIQKATKEHFNARKYLNHISYLFFIHSKDGFLKSSNIKNPFKKLPKPEEVAKRVLDIDETFNREVNEAVEFLNSRRKIKLLPISPLEIHEYSKAYFNGFYSDRTTDSLKTNTRHYQIGNKIASAYVINNSRQFNETIPNISIDDKIGNPDYKFYRGYADALGLSLDMDHVYTQALFMDDHSKLKTKIEISQSTLHGAKDFSAENKRGAEELEKLLDKIASDEKIRLIKAHFNLIFFSDSERDFEINSNKVSAAFRSMDIKPYVPVGNSLANIFNYSFFGFISHLNKENSFVIDLQTALCLLINVDNYISDQEGIYFNDRIFNIPIKKDTWDKGLKRIKARNFFIIGPTGEGKGVIANNVFRQYFEEGVIIVINDLGNSYQKLSKLYPGKTIYIRYKEGQPLGINPFSLQKGIRPDNTQLNQLTEFIRILWKREDALDKEEQVSLNKILLAYYEEFPGIVHSFPHFYYFIQQNVELIFEKLDINFTYFNAEQFLHICSEFVGDGKYSFLFSEQRDFSKDLQGKQFIVFEFDEAKEDPLLLSVLLLISGELTRQLCWVDDTQRSIIFFDEFAKQLKFPNVLNTAQYYYQAARKHECAIGVAIQSPTDLPDSHVSQSIIDNTSVMYILYNDKGYEPVINRFGLSPHDRNQLMSINGRFEGKIRYSEFMLKIGKRGNIVRLELPEKVLCAYLTEGDKNDAIMTLYAITNDMEKAIEMYIELAPKLSKHIEKHKGKLKDALDFYLTKSSLV